MRLKASRWNSIHCSWLRYVASVPRYWQNDTLLLLLAWIMASSCCEMLGHLERLSAMVTNELSILLPFFLGLI